MFNHVALTHWLADCHAVKLEAGGLVSTYKYCAAVHLTLLTFLAANWHTAVTPALEDVHIVWFFLCLLVFKLWARNGQTDGRTDGQARFEMRPI